MNKLAAIGLVCLASCIGLALGTIQYPMKQSYPYMSSMSYGYAPYTSSVGVGGGASGGLTGGLTGGLGNIFELIIFVMVFKMIIGVLLGSGGILGSSGLSGGKSYPSDMEY